MGSELKVGDRVRLRGYDAQGTLWDGEAGRVTAIEGGIVRVKTDELAVINPLVHESACRRLKPRKPPQEWWIAPNFLPNEIAVNIRDQSRIIASTREEKGYIHVREVRPRKERK